MLEYSEFALVLLQIIWINILLSGDNAVVIALACRSLPPQQQKWGIILGTGPAVLLRIVGTLFIVYLMQIPYLKIIGGLLLLWIAVKLMLPEEGQGEDDVSGAGSLIAAVKTIVIADAIMSLDNVIAIAAAARGNVVLLVIGLLISIPLIIFGSTLVLKAIERFPILVPAGSALLGYIAGEVLLTDPAVAEWVEKNLPVVHTVAPYVLAALVVIAGRLLARAMARRRGLDLVS
jgi:YjbE family integral membrane protein